MSARRAGGPGASAALVVGALAFGATLMASGRAEAQAFSFDPPGDLVPGSGDGRVDDVVYVPGMLFPIEGKAYANSQVYGNGGLYGPGGGQCDAVNFSYPWRDNYCEKRSWDMPLCPSGIGHQGQDIRAATCAKDVHWSVASVDGTITSIGSYSVYLTAADGTRHDFLHMDSVQVSVGQKVKRGDKLGRVSNNFGGTATSVHLHFNLRQNVDGLGLVYVPPYTSLVASYALDKEAPPPRGALEVADCEKLVGWALDPETPETAVTVELRVDGTKATQERRVVAGRERNDLCETLGSCGHAFEVAPPLSLFDGESHELRADVIDPMNGDRHELLESPATLSCGPIVPRGERRPLDTAAQKAWKLSRFWDGLPADASQLPVGAALPEEPRAFVDPDDPSRLWFVDGEHRRELAASRALAWHLEVSSLSKADADTLALPVGLPLPERPTLTEVGGANFLVDNAEEAPSVTVTATSGGGSTSESASCAVGQPRSLTPAALLGLAGALGLARARRSRPRSR
jgi:murein DD-endopeptidase MepM/ murein hydrolase activator NlpD